MTVCEVIERETGQHVTPDTTLDELNVDSLEFLDLMLAIKNETGMEAAEGGPVIGIRISDFKQAE